MSTSRGCWVIDSMPAFHLAATCGYATMGIRGPNAERPVVACQSLSTGALPARSACLSNVSHNADPRGA